MGITMSGLLVRMGEDKTPTVLEELFDRKIVNTSVIECNYYRLFEAFDTWDIAAVFDGQNTALFFGAGHYGDGFATLANKLFPAKIVAKIPADYLFYNFVESAMGFIFSYNKNGILYESEFGMNEDEFEHFGDDLLGLTVEDDIAQDGLYLALKEFDIDINKIEKATIFTFSADVREADSKDVNLRSLIRKLSSDISKGAKNNEKNYLSLVKKVLNTLKEKRINITHLALSGDAYKACKVEWSKLNNKSLGELETNLIDRVIMQTDTEKAFAQLVYLDKYYEYKKTKSELKKSLIPVVAIIILLIVAALMIFLFFN
jgi:hypothetical protein